MYGIYEELYDPSDSNIGAYLILAVVAFMMIRATPNFLRMFLPQVRMYPLVIGAAAFLWLLLVGKYLLGLTAMVVGVLVSQWLMSPARAKDQAPVDRAMGE